MFAFSVTAARRAVHDTLVIGVKLHNHGWQERLDLSKMTGYQGATGGPWIGICNYVDRIDSKNRNR